MAKRKPKPLHVVDGARELRRSLREAGDDFRDLKDAHREAAQIAANASLGRTPVKSGALKRTIRAAGTKTAGLIRAGKKAVPYAKPVHWGWKDRNIKANPFMYAAAKSTEPQWVRAFEDRVDEITSQIEGAKQ